ncbi:Flp family type IVb pilin [Vibrio genomosp. F10]|uniref:Flp family type IVb pilin n=1 Tax=Vibrio genomosp. F10 TaxID=723171 RepID=UPI0002D47441|nr:hypothetical protein [Vibrio genomosp. F10]
MKHFLNVSKEFFANEEGLTVVEYVVGAGAMIIGLSGFFTVVYGILTDEFESVFSSSE